MRFHGNRRATAVKGSDEDWSLREEKGRHDSLFPRHRTDRMRPMNVIVVVCNSLHLGFLGAYGNAWIETPNLDRLASEGVVFDHHFPENLTTLPTRRTWWTGRYGFADAEQGWTALRHDELI